MRIPDYISPIIGWRVWQWDASGLKSLNGEPWLPGKPLHASCRASGSAALVGRARANDLSHDAPKMNCSCGIYGSKSLDRLRISPYWQYGSVHGEVSLCGDVVEPEQGFRAQYAYPKGLVIPLGMMPVSMSMVKLRLETLAAFGCDILVSSNEGNLPLWVRDSAYDSAGLDLLIQRCEVWYAQQARERRIKRGDRVAVGGRGIAVVEQVDGKWIRAVLWNKRTLIIARECILWDDQNVRWETSTQACIETNAKA